MKVKSPQLIVGETGAGGGMTWCSDPTVNCLASATGIYDISLPQGYRIVSVTAGPSAGHLANLTTVFNRVSVFTLAGANANVAVRFIAAKI